MGRVYRARHPVLDREYAIKVLFGDFAVEPKFAERFRREAQSISRVRHTNIVTVEDFGRTDGGLIFLALELVKGQPLHRIIDQGPVAPEVAARIVEQLVEGLGAAHDAGLVHRDIKPQNIMVAADGTVKILDFGAVNMVEAPTNERLTAAGNIVGTPAYMAPEQSQDSDVGPAADFYSVGIVLFEMLTGHLPFNGRTRAEILVKHIAEPVPDLPPSLGLEHLARQLLEKHAHSRPSKAEEVLAYLRRLPVSTGADSQADALPPPIAKTQSSDVPATATQSLQVPPLDTADLVEAALPTVDFTRVESFPPGALVTSESPALTPTHEATELDPGNEPYVWDDDRTAVDRQPIQAPITDRGLATSPDVPPAPTLSVDPWTAPNVEDSAPTAPHPRVLPPPEADLGSSGVPQATAAWMEQPLPAESGRPFPSQPTTDFVDGPSDDVKANSRLPILIALLVVLLVVGVVTVGVYLSGGDDPIYIVPVEEPPSR